MRQCAICHKGSQMGGHRILLRGHYNPTNWTRKYPNLQYAKYKGIRTLMCTACLKSLNKGPRVRVRKTVAAKTTAKA